MGPIAERAPRLRGKRSAGQSPITSHAVLCTFFLSAMTQSTSAQTITGQVVDSISRTPVGSGFVVMLDANGNEVNRVLTSDVGRFTFRLPDTVGWPITLRSERIGYFVSVSQPIVGETISADGVTLFVRPLPRRLEEIEARDATECRVRPSETERTAVVWEEVRKALAAASWTASQTPYRVISNMTTRDLDARRRYIISETHRPFVGLTTSPFVSRPPEELIQRGYVTRDDGSYVYTSPDAHVMQSLGFLDTHCFRLSEQNPNGLVGLAFEPVPSRDLPEVEGTLWLDPESWELRSLEYQFTNLPNNLVAGDPAHGSIEFLRLPSGAWIVNEWSIEFPIAFRDERVGEFDRQTRRRVEAYRSVGGEVLTISEPSGTSVYETEFANIVGVVRDNSNGTDSLAGSIVSVVNTWFADTADEKGRFHLRVPLAGEYGIVASHPRIDSLVFGPEPVSVTLTRGTFTEVALEVPPIDELFSRVCPNRPPSADRRVLVGIVTDSATNTPVRGAGVVARWQDITPRLDFFNRQADFETDQQGRFALCGLALGRPAIVYAVTDRGRSEVLRVGFEPGHIEIGGVGVGSSDTQIHESDQRVWRRDLSLSASAGLNTLLAGTVRDRSSGLPLSGIDVELPGTGLNTQTDSLGLFQFTGVAPGVHRLSLRGPGFVSRSGNVTIERDQPTFIDASDLALEPAAQLMGVVRESETGRPIPGAWMTLVSMSGDSVVRTRSDSLGRFVLSASEGRPYNLSVRRVGYAPETLGPYTLRTSEVTDANISLDPGIFALDPINVVADAPDQYLSTIGFYQRQRANRGYFMDRADIEERLGSSPDAFQLLAALPGVGIADAPPGEFGSRVTFNRGAFSAQDCGQGPAIYIDGFRFDYGSNGGQPPFDAIGMAVRPEDIYAMEVYRTPSQIPIQYGGTEAACGVLLIWTWRGGNY